VETSRSLASGFSPRLSRDAARGRSLAEAIPRPDRPAAQKRADGGRAEPAVRSYDITSPVLRCIFIPPYEPTLRDRPPKGEGWLYEVKFDGYRMQVQHAAAACRCTRPASASPCSPAKARIGESFHFLDIGARARMIVFSLAKIPSFLRIMRILSDVQVFSIPPGKDGCNRYPGS
jgi:hypothetical protein